VPRIMSYQQWTRFRTTLDEFLTSEKKKLQVPGIFWDLIAAGSKGRESGTEATSLGIMTVELKLGYIIVRSLKVAVWLSWQRRWSHQRS